MSCGMASSTAELCGAPGHGDEGAYWMVNDVVAELLE
jgi:hypothetical protein